MTHTDGNSQPKIAMVVYSYYPDDPRVRREAEALRQRGMHVDVICLKGKHEPPTDTSNGVNVFRIKMGRKRGGKSTYVFEYFKFLVLSLLKLGALHWKINYQVVHVHNMPDILVFASIIPKLSGARIVLDLHDPMPEVYMAKYNIPGTHAIIRLLIYLERLCIIYADKVLTPNIAFRDLFIDRGCPKDKIHVVMNSPQETVFDVNPDTIEPNVNITRDTFILMFHGTIVERHGLDTALEAISRLRDRIPNIIFKVYGDGDDFVETFHAAIKKMNLENIVVHEGRVSLEVIAKTIRTVHVGIIPNKRSAFTEINFPTRIFEYLCLGKPVVVPNTIGIRDYFNSESISFFEPGNSESLANVLWDIYTDPQKSMNILENGISIYKKHSWKYQKEDFVNIINSLITRVDNCGRTRN